MLIINAMIGKSRFILETKRARVGGSLA